MHTQCIYEGRQTHHTCTHTRTHARTYAHTHTHTHTHTHHTQNPIKKSTIMSLNQHLVKQNEGWPTLQLSQVRPVKVGLHTHCPVNWSHVAEPLTVPALVQLQSINTFRTSFLFKPKQFNEFGAKFKNLHKFASAFGRGNEHPGSIRTQSVQRIALSHSKCCLVSRFH